MKTSLKQLLCSVLAAVLVLALIPQAFASSYAYTVTDVTLTGTNTLSAKYVADKPQAGYAIIYAFSKQGKLIGVNYKEINTSLTEDTVSLTLSSTAFSNLALVEASVWGGLSTLKPLAEALSVAPKDVIVPEYGANSNFIVAATDANINANYIIDDQMVYTLKVMEDGDYNASTLCISTEAKISYYDTVSSSYVTVNYADNASVIKKGAAFLYTLNKDGLVDKIDVIFNGGYTFKDLLSGNYTVAIPDNSTGNIIIDENWLVDPERWNKNPNAVNLIQIFVAPVLYTAGSNVAFSVVNGNYVDGNIDYIFKVSEDTRIYSYDLSARADTGTGAFGVGDFSGISIDDTDDMSRAWFSTLGYDVPTDETDFDGMIQMAFVMAVDNVVTNAIVMNN